MLVEPPTEGNFRGHRTGRRDRVHAPRRETQARRLREREGDVLRQHRRPQACPDLPDVVRLARRRRRPPGSTSSPPSASAPTTRRPPARGSWSTSRSTTRRPRSTLDVSLGRVGPGGFEPDTVFPPRGAVPPPGRVRRPQRRAWSSRRPSPTGRSRSTPPGSKAPRPPRRLFRADDVLVLEALRPLTLDSGAPSGVHFVDLPAQVKRGHGPDGQGDRPPERVEDPSGRLLPRHPHRRRQAPRRRQGRRRPVPIDPDGSVWSASLSPARPQGPDPLDRPVRQRDRPLDVRLGRGRPARRPPRPARRPAQSASSRATAPSPCSTSSCTTARASSPRPRGSPTPTARASSPASTPATTSPRA